MRKSAHKHNSDARMTERFNRILFAFYRKEGRTMPWRRTRNPYRILVSEIMLQQTQVDRVREKYAEFLRRFPSVEDLAHAPLGDILRAWSGLGYNRRAKYLHDCAKEIVAEGGKFPRDIQSLTSLPGIGISTAAGVMAFAWNLPEPMIDTNLRRVLHRVFFPLTKRTDQQLYVFAKGMIPKGKGREWNYAMLDAAAMKCTARNHRVDCPFMSLHGVIAEEKTKKATARFIDTDRYARGRLLEALRSADKPVHSRTLSKKAGRPLKKTHILLQRLEKEGLIVKRGSGYELP